MTVQSIMADGWYLSQSFHIRYSVYRVRACVRACMCQCISEWGREEKERA